MEQPNGFCDADDTHRAELNYDRCRPYEVEGMNGGVATRLVLLHDASFAGIIAAQRNHRQQE
jgi:hypothetical protein